MKGNYLITVKEVGLNSPETWKPCEIEGTVHYPVIKPDRGCESRSVRVLNNNQEYKFVISQMNDAVIQEYIGVPEDEYYCPCDWLKEQREKICFYNRKLMAELILLSFFMKKGVVKL